MNTPPLLLGGFPQAIVHLDADAFFAAVEQALSPELKGKPVVTGAERGIIACANYAAKALGIQRGTPLGEARQRCRQLVILPSDYETYSLYSKRMFTIMRRYTPCVEEYSVDEAFADITGMRRVFHCSYEDIARRMQRDIQAELDITVSVGLSLSKSLAKLCSKFRKPNGFTAVRASHIHLLLQHTPLERVWGFGPNSVSLLRKHGLQTAYDVVTRPEAWIGQRLHKPGRELWHELRGTSLWKVSTEPKNDYATIMKSKTFTPASSDPDLVFAHLVRNVESAFMKARRHKLRPTTLTVVLRQQDFQHAGLEARLNRPTAATVEVLPLVRHLFEQLVMNGTCYRATMAILGNLESDASEQPDLFEDRLRIAACRRLTTAVDAVNRVAGKHKLGAGTALHLRQAPPPTRTTEPERRHTLHLRGETARKRLGIPRLDLLV